MAVWVFIPSEVYLLYYFFVLPLLLEAVVVLHQPRYCKNGFNFSTTCSDCCSCQVHLSILEVLPRIPHPRCVEQWLMVLILAVLLWLVITANFAGGLLLSTCSGISKILSSSSMDIAILLFLVSEAFLLFIEDMAKTTTYEPCLAVTIAQLHNWWDRSPLSQYLQMMLGSHSTFLLKYFGGTSSWSSVLTSETRYHYHCHFKIWCSTILHSFTVPSSRSLGRFLVEEEGASMLKLESKELCRRRQWGNRIWALRSIGSDELWE